VGIDDFALRKGQRYGTILVDLEKHQVIDLLPDRETETVKKWLEDHPAIETITRDRSQAYAEAVTAGAPQAVQIADRFHIFKNLMEAVEQSLSRHHSILRQAATAILPEQYQAAISDVNKILSLAATPKSKSEELRSQQRREKRLARFQEVKRLHKEGFSIRAIGRELGMDREAVRNFIRAEIFPERALVLSKPSIIEQYLPYLKLRWEQGCYNVRQLYREIKKRGYNASRVNLYRYLKPWRSMLPEELKRLRARPCFSPLSPKEVAWLLIKAEKDLDKDEQAYLTMILNLSPEIKLIQELTLSFQQMLKNSKVELLDEWMSEVKSNNLPEFQSFVKGIERDEAVVRAGLTYQWSNGQVEGQVNRLKFIKRSMYGRAKFDLLKKRVLIKI
jgi:transposase